MDANATKNASNVDPDRELVDYVGRLGLSVGASVDLIGKLRSIGASPRAMAAGMRVATAARHVANIVAHEECERVGHDTRPGRFQANASRIGLFIAGFVAKEKDLDARARLEARNAVLDVAASAHLQTAA